MNTFQPGNLVKFSAPLDAKEAELQFVVIEMRGPRVLVEASTIAMHSQHVYMADEMELAE